MPGAEGSGSAVDTPGVSSRALGAEAAVAAGTGVGAVAAVTAAVAAACAGPETDDAPGSASMSIMSAEHDSADESSLWLRSSTRGAADVEPGSSSTTGRWGRRTWDGGGMGGGDTFG